MKQFVTYYVYDHLQDLGKTISKKTYWETHMKRRLAMKGLLTIAAYPLIELKLPDHAIASPANLAAVTPLNKPYETWRAIVSPEAFQVLFEEKTELPGSSPLNGEHRAGTFICAACFLPLFDSSHKYESGTGWPSFTQPIAEHTATKLDYKMIIPRIEYHCARCGGHQGHVFKDGPLPRKERWCNNGIALKFILLEQDLPTLRG